MGTVLAETSISLDGHVASRRTKSTHVMAGTPTVRAADRQ